MANKSLASAHEQLALTKAAVERIDEAVSKTQTDIREDIRDLKKGIRNLQTDIREDIRELRRWLIGSFLILASAGSAAYLLVERSIKGPNNHLAGFETKSTDEIETKLTALDVKVGALDNNLKGAPTILPLLPSAPQWDADPGGYQGAIAYYNQGNAKADLGHHEDAITDYDQVIKLRPDYVKAYYNRGNAKANLDRHEDAIADYDQAIKLRPGLAVLSRVRGIPA